MDWNRAIVINQAALRLVVAEIYAMLELVLDGHVKRLPHLLYVAASRLLIPAESALRRLIVIAARDLKVEIPHARPMPKDSRIIAKGISPPRFQLFDIRKRFDRITTPAKTISPRLHVFGFTPLVADILPKAKKEKTSQNICRRFAAFTSALENISREAKRLALWQAKRALLKETKFRFPLRPGVPPGFRRKIPLEIDRILKECHLLAGDLARAAPS